MDQKNVITAENHNFLKDVSHTYLLSIFLNLLPQVVDQVLIGDGVGWLKLSRLRKLMEDENYRNMILAKLNNSMDRKVAPDDHIQDIVSTCHSLTYFKV